MPSFVAQAITALFREIKVHIQTRLPEWTEMFDHGDGRDRADRAA
jgi:hypothetical protein